MGHRAEDIVATLLHFLRERGSGKFEASPQALHPILHDWRVGPRGSVLSSFTFDTRDHIPFSDTVEEAFDALQFAGYLERSNPRGVFYEIRPKLDQLFKKISHQFDGDELESLKQLADRVGTSLQTRESA